MPSLDDLKKRIKSVKSTQKITKAMKMVAAAKLKKAQESAEKGRPYSDKMQNIILNLTKSFKENSNAPKLLLGSGEDSVYLCVIMTADRGLCGGFNTNICKLAKKKMREFLNSGKKIKIITVGSKGYDQLKKEFNEFIIEKKSLNYKLRSKGPNEWNKARIIVKGGKVEHWLNNILVVRYDRFSQTFRNLIKKSKFYDKEGFGVANEGRILLQDHHPGDVKFKNIKIREL